MPSVLAGVRDRAALEGDVARLMAALPALVRAARYGDVRGTDPAAKREALSELIAQYRPALRSHLVLRQRMDPDKADDLLQSFLCDKVVEQNFVERA